MGGGGLVTVRAAARAGAPVVFLAAVTIAVLLVRSGLDTRPAPVTGTVATTASTQTGTTAAKRSNPKGCRYSR